MDFLTQEPSDPELALMFADLTIVAALLLGNDGETGMAHYCKGSILFRLGSFAKAVGPLNDAQAYLRSAGDRRQLGNCLFDAANCLGVSLASTGAPWGCWRRYLGVRMTEKTAPRRRSSCWFSRSAAVETSRRSWTVFCCSRAGAR